MLLSMTGFGEAQAEVDGMMVRVEVRSVNNRHLKLSCRLPDGYAALESPLEALVRQEVRRGAIQLNLSIDRAVSAQDYRINPTVLVGYYEQLQQIRQQLSAHDRVSLEGLLTLPGVIEECLPARLDVDTQWPLLQPTVKLALDRLNAMRQEEGKAMERDLRANCQTMRAELVQIRQRVPQVVQAYQQRLQERLNSLLAAHEVEVTPSDIVREVGMFADRMDVAEEIIRLESHLDQMESLLSSDESGGRKLDFLIQEMLREANTIGSKSGDLGISQAVLEIKGSLERLREQVQNIE